jgi:hypothetical protein
MAREFRDPPAATPLLDVEPVVQRHATCPLCHTTDVSLSDDALTAGGWWRCTRCSQRWDARRLATAAAYAAWALEHATATGGDYVPRDIGVQKFSDAPKLDLWQPSP